MAFQIDPNIPLQAMANPINIGESFARAQSYQANALKLQALRDKFDEEKAEKLRQKQMRQGMASELQKMQQGTPAQYDVSFPQTMPTGQMPSGMTGVLANERGQNMPQPALFGENILQGDFDINHEMVSPAIAPKQPDIKDVLTAQFNAAVANNDVATAFDATKKLKELEKNPTKYFQGLTKGVDPKTNKPLFLAMTESGVVPVDGYQPYEEPKTPKTSLITTSKGYEVVKEGELPKGQPVKSTRIDPRARLQQVTDATGTYILNLDTGETSPVLINGRPVEKIPLTPSGEESNAAGFLVRMKDATKLLDTFEEKGKPSIGTTAASSVPFIGGYLERTAQTKEQQQYKNAALAWIRAKLRKESGAAIGIVEAENEYQNYFPVIGDTKEVVAQKRSLRQSAMDEMLIASGKAAPKVEAARPTLQTVDATVTGETKIVKTRADLDKVKSGESYIAPDGKLWVKP